MFKKFLLATTLYALTAVFVIANDDAPQFDVDSQVVTLNNGVKMPISGFGTAIDGRAVEDSVALALKVGTMLVDTANVYNNEEAVGRGIKKSGVPREKIFVTSKLWPDSYDNAEKAIDETLKRLDLEYLDLLLLHQANGNYVKAYQAMEKAVEAGKIRAIGLSNFYGDKLDEIIEVAKIKPAVLQIETNPYKQQKDVRPTLDKHGIALEAWAPLGGQGGSRNLLSEETIVEIAKAHKRSAAQIILRWHLQSKNIAIPGSSNPDYIKENHEIFDFELTEDEMNSIGELDGKGANFGGFPPPQFGGFPPQSGNFPPPQFGGFPPQSRNRPDRNRK